MMLLLCFIMMGTGYTFESGTYFAEPPEAFAIESAKGMAADKEGNIYLLDGGARRILIFEKDGTFLGHFGQAGSGPGELSMTNNMGMITIVGDEIIVFDESSRKFSIWGTDLQFRRAVPLSANLERAKKFFTMGSQLVFLNQSSNKGLYDVLLLDKDFQPEKSLFSIKSATFFKNKKGAYDYQPMAAKIIVSPLEDRLFVASTVENEIYQMDLNGKKLATYRVPLEAPDVEQEDMDFYMDSFRTWAGPDDRILFPEKDAVTDLIWAHPKYQILIASQFRPNEGRFRGVAIDIQSGRILNHIDVSMGEGLSELNTVQGRLLMIGPSPRGENTIREIRVVYLP